MKIAFKVEQEEFNGYKFNVLYIIIDDTPYKIGTLKKGENINYINCVHRTYNK